MIEKVWTCKVIRMTDGSLALDLPEELVKALRITAGDELAVEKARNGFFEMWKPESPDRAGRELPEQTSP